MLSGYAFVHWPSLLRREVPSLGDVLHWAMCVDQFKDFISSNSSTPRQVALSLPIYVRDMYLRAGRGTGDKMTLG